MKKSFLKKIITVGIITSIIMSMYSISASAVWVQNKDEKWHWMENEKEAKGWKEINNKWYYFNKDGEMNTGWFKDNEKWYHLSDEGEMNIGWKKIGDNWYQFGQNGAMNTGWVQEDGNWYFMNVDGQMETGTVEIDGSTYTFSESGIMQSNYQTIHNVETNESEQSDSSTAQQGIKGYVCTSSDALNVRSSASVSASVIGTLPKGSEIVIVDKEQNGFYPISLNGTTGWVSETWISFQKGQDSNKDSNEDSKKIELKNDSLSTQEIRTTEPSIGNKYYYSDDNVFYKAKLSPPFISGGRVIKGNCTWYAWGRAWEITGIRPIDAGFIGNAYQWWEANKKSGKYQYGTEPRVGSIAVWNSNLPNSGGDGHVAIVEKIEDGKVYISESMWHGASFKYREIYEINYLNGYIYLDKPNY